MTIAKGKNPFVLSRGEVVPGQCFKYVSGPEINFFQLAKNSKEIHRLRLPKGWEYAVFPHNLNVPAPERLWPVKLIPHYETGEIKLIRRQLRAGDCFQYKPGQPQIGPLTESRKFLIMGYADNVALAMRIARSMGPEWSVEWEVDGFRDLEVLLINPSPGLSEEAKSMVNYSKKEQDEAVMVHMFEEIQRKADTRAINREPKHSPGPDLRDAWSSALRKKVEESKQKEESRIVVDWGDFWD